MAQALRTVWLEPEELQEPLAPRIKSRRRRTMPNAWHGPLAALCMVAVVAMFVGCVVAYIYSNARIARFEAQRQTLSVQLRELSDDTARLKLDVARLETTPRISHAAQARNLEYPTTDRVHYVRVAKDFPTTAVAQASPDAARSRHTVIARVERAFQRLARGPGVPAYAQD